MPVDDDILVWVLCGLSTQLNVDFISQVDDRPASYRQLQRYFHRIVLRLAISHVRLNRPKYLRSQFLHHFARRANHWLLNHVLCFVTVTRAT